MSTGRKASLTVGGLGHAYQVRFLYTCNDAWGAVDPRPVCFIRCDPYFRRLNRGWFCGYTRWYSCLIGLGFRHLFFVLAVLGREAVSASLLGVRGSPIFFQTSDFAAEPVASLLCAIQIHVGPTSIVSDRFHLNGLLDLADAQEADLVR